MRFQQKTGLFSSPVGGECPQAFIPGEVHKHFIPLILIRISESRLLTIVYHPANP